MKTRFLPLFLILIVIPNSSAISGIYDITVAENGNSFVVIALDGNGTVNIPLPLDVESLIVENALYLQAENGIDILLADDSAFIAYYSSILTSKKGDTWDFEMEIPILRTAEITLSLPKNVAIIETSPKAMIKNLENSVDVYWELKNFGENKKISLSYKFLEAPMKTIVTTTFLTTKVSTEEKQEIREEAIYIIAILVILIVAFISYSKFKKRSNPKKIENGNDHGIILSKGKRNVMKTLSGNEIKIITVLLEHNGKMLRNELEKISGIPKSSLSVAINNLERKNILQVDKSEWTHEVELSEWFKAL
ncbi:MAG: hypothetical protein QXY62_02580 [Candidatus Altiarchaeota archaeon]